MKQFCARCGFQSGYHPTVAPDTPGPLHCMLCDGSKWSDVRVHVVRYPLYLMYPVPEDCRAHVMRMFHLEKGATLVVASGNLEAFRSRRSELEAQGWRYLWDLSAIALALAWLNLMNTRSTHYDWS